MASKKSKPDATTSGWKLYLVVANSIKTGATTLLQCGVAVASSAAAAKSGKTLWTTRGGSYSQWLLKVAKLCLALRATPPLSAPFYI